MAKNDEIKQKICGGLESERAKERKRGSGGEGEKKKRSAKNVYS